MVLQCHGSHDTNAETVYQVARCNANLLKIIQLGITFCDAEGRTPEGGSTWQFNFKFDLGYVTRYFQPSIA